MARAKGFYAQGLCDRTEGLHCSGGKQAMTRLVYRGIAYSMEEEHRAFSAWWAFVHRPTLWLLYRGIKYRPCQFDKGGARAK